MHRIRKYGLISAIFFIFIHHHMDKAIKTAEPWALNQEICSSENPILALEFATSESEIQEIFPEEKDERIAAVKRHTYLDFGFILAYCVMLLYLVYKAFRKEARLLRLLSILTLVAGLSDVFENLFILHILKLIEAPTGMESALSNMAIFVWIKWILIGLVFLSILVRALIHLGKWILSLKGSSA